MTRLADAVYRMFLLAFPSGFRHRHGHDMRVQFQLQCDRVGGRPLALTLLFARALADALSQGVAARREARPSAARPSRRERPLLAFTQDLRHAVRGLRRERGVTAIVVLTLTLGISANAIMFGVVDQLLLSPPAGVGHPGDVRRIYFGSDNPTSNGYVGTSTSYPEAVAVRDGVPAFAMGTVLFGARDVSIGAGADAREGRLELVDAAYFPLLELLPSSGRFFTAEEDAVPVAAHVIVLSHGFWQRAFGADPGIVGRDIRIEGKAFTVVGIGPAGFAGVNESPVDLWTPLGAMAPEFVGEDWHTKPFQWRYSLIARLAPQATDAVADAQATAAARQAVPTGGPAGMTDTLVTAFVVPLARIHDPSGVIEAGKVGLWLLGVSAVVLLIAVANVAYVLLTRTLTRRREIGVRLALGISRRRLMRQLLTESSVLTALAAAVALAVAWVGGAMVQQIVLPTFIWTDGVVDGRVLAITLGLTVLTTLGAGLGPAVYGLATDLNAAIRPASPVAIGPAGVARTGLLLAQVSLSVVLLVGAGLFVRSFHAVSTQDVGIDLDRIIVARIPDRPGAALEESDAIHQAAMERLARLPQVERVALTRSAGPWSRTSAIAVRTENETWSGLTGRGMPGFTVVTSDYFSTIGASIERGRGFTQGDEIAASPVVVINSAMAAARWPNSDALDRCLFINRRQTCNRVVGIVENTLDRVANSHQQLFLLATHSRAAGEPPHSILVRTSGAATPHVAAVRQALQTLSADMPFVSVDSMETLTGSQLQPWRLGATMFLIFGGVALLIAAVGLYSAMTHLVAQRTHEIGIRMALGASRRHVISRIGTQGAVSIAAGVGIGLLGAALASDWIGELLYKTSPRDPWVFTSVAVVLGLAGLAAAIVPLRRSTSVDPLVVLKTD